MYYVRDFVIAGRLISYGPSFDEMAKQVGIFLRRILEGAKPAELPVSSRPNLSWSSISRRRRRSASLCR
jgi:ABC-type uncharacterized transport system substrate-binding protein